jgi:hypothetical protein
MGMAGEQSVTDGVELPWPTVFLHRTLPGAELANKALSAFVLELEAGNRDLTTDYLGGNLLANDHPAIAWLRDCINRTVADYFRQLGMDYQIDWSLQGWANVNRLGDYHDPHNHPHSYLSGNYYVQTPTDRAPLQSRKDARPGAISFYDPRDPQRPLRQPGTHGAAESRRDFIMAGVPNPFRASEPERDAAHLDQLRRRAEVEGRLLAAAGVEYRHSGTAR